MSESPYGVDWPAWSDTTAAVARTSGSKFEAGFSQTERELRAEFERMDADRWHLDHESGSGGFPGVVARWTVGDVDHAVACDAHTTKSANAREVYLWVKENRLSDDRPVDTGQDQFAAAQLPGGGEEAVVATRDGTLDRDRAAELLGVRADAHEQAIRGAAERMLRKGHPDHGGDANVAEIQEARDLLLGGRDE